MGGRGASSGVSVKGKKYGTEYVRCSNIKTLNLCSIMMHVIQKFQWRR